jgi:hypothetical protein
MGNRTEVEFCEAIGRISGVSYVLLKNLNASICRSRISVRPDALSASLDWEGTIPNCGGGGGSSAVWEKAIAELRIKHKSKAVFIHCFINKNSFI